MSRPDILIVLSDQHSAACAGFAGNGVVETPNLDRLAAGGTVFEAAYTSCPLCVPARAGLLTGQTAAQTGIFTNHDIIASDQATFLHSLAAVGYETVLCGRMHFKGPDQRHGFTRRIFPDVTHAYGGGISDFGPFSGVVGMGGCVDMIGAGNSPVLEYDRQVTERAVDYLEKDHEKPQCIVLGTYGPHFPYVAPRDLYEKYLDTVRVPESFHSEMDTYHPVTESKAQRTRHNLVEGADEAVTENIAQAARAAYYGMISFLDRRIGLVREAWLEHLDRTGRRSLFLYTSDHGDTVGEHGVFGKQTFYEGSSRIPMIVEGAGVREGGRIASPVSILDIGPTLCDVTRATTPPRASGKSLLEAIETGAEDPERAVLSEYMEGLNGKLHPGRMIRRGRWKLVHYHGLGEHDLLFDIDSDPEETQNLAKEYPEKADALRSALKRDWEVDRLKAHRRERDHHGRLIRNWAEAVEPAELEHWVAPEEACEMPSVIAGAGSPRETDFFHRTGNNP